jgi:hypothetical protein
MTTKKTPFKDTYTMPVDPLHYDVSGAFDSVFDFKYSDERDDLLHLYDKGKRMQWNAVDRIDWSLDLKEGNPIDGPEELFPLYGLDDYMKMSEKQKGELRTHWQAWQNSQFLHGEQGALICAAKIVQQVPDTEAKFYAATQVMDEARHVETYKKLLEKFGVSYPMTGPLQTLLDQVIRDSRWDMTYLGMQVVIEGLALAAFAGTRDYAKNKLAQQVNAYVMQDEARHVAFGRLALRAYYPHLSEAERKEREEFLVEACYLMRDRFMAREVWEHMGMNADAAVEHMEHSEGAKTFRKFLFSRIVPVVKDIGLWDAHIINAYTDMGVLDFSMVDIDMMQAHDEQVAQQLDAENAERRKHIESIAARAVAAE